MCAHAGARARNVAPGSSLLLRVRNGSGLLLCVFSGMDVHHCMAHGACCPNFIMCASTHLHGCRFMKGWLTLSSYISCHVTCAFFHAASRSACRFVCCTTTHRTTHTHTAPLTLAPHHSQAAMCNLLPCASRPVPTWSPPPRHLLRCNTGWPSGHQHPAAVHIYACNVWRGGAAWRAAGLPLPAVHTMRAERPFRAHKAQRSRTGCPRYHGQ